MNRSIYAKMGEVWKRRHDGSPIQVAKAPKPIGSKMSANAANRVKDAVERVVTDLERAADGTSARLNKLTSDALDKFHRVEKSVADPLEQALKDLDSLLGDNGGPQ